MLSESFFMRVSQYFLPLIKEDPKEASIASHRLMLRAGMIQQEASGIYSWLPLGLRVLNKVAEHVRAELNAAGCIELLMPTLQPTDLWQESGRYNALGEEMLRMKDRAGRELLYSPTCEEMIVNMVRNHVRSYKQLPLHLYQIQWKFRDEIRPRFGVMRGREFFMKDGYSFHETHEDALAEYEKLYVTYSRIFSRLGLTSIAVKADSGAIGGALSHEFQVLAETGESEIFYDAALDDLRHGSRDIPFEEVRALYAAADEMHDPENCPIPKEQLRTARGIEVGHIFLLGRKYTDAMGLDITDAQGNPKRVEMGTYGIGVSRLVGALIEAHHDARGIVWPSQVAPFDVGIIHMRPGDEACDTMANEVYETACRAGLSPLLDDTNQSSGAKFASMDLIGLPWQMVVGPRGAKAAQVELKCRATGETENLSVEAAIQKLTRISDA
jgi:prolyl-tRNA synthetase